jgi:hypothetical protein
VLPRRKLPSDNRRERSPPRAFGPLNPPDGVLKESFSLKQKLK